MAKIVINDIESGFMSQNAINEAFNTVEQELNNKVLYRDNPSGEPNQMENNLDMNDFDVINVGNLSADTVNVGGVDLSTAIQDVSDALDSIAPAVADAETAAANAAASASSAASSASSASSSASSAASAASSTATSLAAFEVLLDTFDDRYLGAKASDPTVDNDGNPLVAGTVYYNTTDNELKFYNGTTWESPSASAEASATSALNSANAADNSATDAAASASAAAISASNASTSASNASTSASNASTSASNAASSASTATTKASEASSSANDSAASASLANDWATKTSGPVAGGEYSAKYYAQQADTSEANAATSASNASSSASSAASSASSAASSASSAASSASSAATSASNAATSASNAAAAYDQFDDRYLGDKSSDPSVDNDGNALLEGALYWNTGSKNLRVYNGTSWQNTANTASGTVTSVSGTGTVSGITLSGTVSTSGNLTLGGSLDLSSPPAIGNTTPNTGKFTTLEAVNSGANSGLTMLRNTDQGTNSTRIFLDSSSGISTIYNSAGSILFNTAATIGTTSGVNQFRIAPTTSAVNYVQVTGATTTNRPTISSQGSDTNVGLNIQSKNSGAMIFTRQRDAVNSSQYLFEYVGGLTADSNGGAFWRGLHLGAPNYTVSGSNRFPRMAQYFELQSTTNPTYTNAYYAIGNANGLNIEGVFSNESGGGWTFKNASSFSSDISFRIATPLTTDRNYLQVAGAATNLEPVLSAQGSDTNISLAIQPKGTGSIDLASGSTGVNVSNGNTVTAITRTAYGSGYTTLPTWTASTPNIAGGVQATGQAATLLAVSATVASGGTGYTLGDTLTLVGGTSTLATTVTVSAVSGGVVTGVLIAINGSYTVAPSSPATTTGGTGTGCAINISYGVSTLSITNAGSGYTSQPTVTFSGGGGSGASAYATVGSATIFRSLAGSAASQQSLSFNTPAGEAVRINDAGLTTDSYVAFKGGNSTSNGVYISALGTARNMYISSGAGQAISFFTGGEGSATQLRVSHTASAVNYVQVTGQSTGNFPSISAQGSDANIGFDIFSKGTSPIRARTGGGEQFRVANVASAVNYVQVYGAPTTGAVTIESAGSDANIWVNHGAKGTGRHQFLTNNAVQFQVAHAASPVNYLQATGSATGTSPTLSAIGSDSNININLIPKGTGNVQQNGTALALSTHKYHAFVDNTYYHDRYEQGNYFRLFTENAVTDIVRYGTIHSVEYYDYGTSTWTNWSGGTAGVQNLLDGNQTTGMDVAHANRTFRFVVSANTWPTSVLIMLQSTWSAITYTPATVTIASGTSSTGPFTTRATMTFNSANSGSEWGMHAHYKSNALHNGDGFYQVTIDITDWVDSGSYVAYPLRNFCIFSNYQSAGKIVPYTTSYDKYATFIGGIRTPADVNGSLDLGRYNGQDSVIDTGSNATGLTMRTKYNTQFRVANTDSAVNYVQVTGAGTTGQPKISAQGSDASVALRIASKGTFNIHLENGSSQAGFMVSPVGAANYLQATSANANNAPVLSSQGSDTNIDLSLTTKGTGTVKFNTGAGEVFRIAQGAAAGSNYWRAEGAAVTPFLITSGNNGIIATGGTGVLQFITNTAQEQFRVSHTASAVNYVQVTGGATGVSPSITPQGSDADISLNLTSKGTGLVNILSASNVGRGSTNWIQLAGSSTGASVSATALGGDTNIDITLTPKGTGKVVITNGIQGGTF